MKTNPLYFLLVSLLITSCNSEAVKEDSGTSEKETKIELALFQDEILSLIINDTSEVLQVYTSNDNKPFWLLNNGTISEEAQKVIFHLENAKFYGLNPESYRAYSLDSLYDVIGASELDPKFYCNFDVLLTQEYIHFGTDLHNGLVSNGALYTDLKLKKDTLDFVNVMQSGNLESNLLALQPQHPEYLKLQKSLQEFVTNNILEDTIITIPNFKKDSIKAYTKAKEVLLRLNYLTPADGDSVVSALMKFQEDNGLTPDGLIGKHTARMLEYSTEQIYFQAAVNLERWRWVDDWGGDFFFANIPEYVLKVYKNDSLVKVNRTVVGTSYTPTPEVESKIEYFIVNPEWYVPISITSGELIPKMKKDPTYLERNGYAISNEGVSISDIDWENVTSGSFKYKIKQKSGSSNALGKVKFIFDNKHSVYLHDTPSKSFFEKDIRSYSHGCVRLQNPFEIANYILNEEQNTEWISSLDSIVASKKTRTFTPKGVYPIHIGYFTSTGNDQGKLRTLIDIYEKDVPLLEEFKKLYYDATKTPSQVTL